MAAYAVGMFKETDYVFPSGLKGYQEIILISLVGMSITGIKTFILSLTLLALVQFIDDLVDYHRDMQAGTSNLFCALGRLESTIVLVILLLINLFFQPIYTIFALFTVVVIEKTSTLKWKGMGM